jgi:hypothetical protein
VSAAARSCRCPADAGSKEGRQQARHQRGGGSAAGAVFASRNPDQGQLGNQALFVEFAVGDNVVEFAVRDNVVDLRRWRSDIKPPRLPKECR